MGTESSETARVTRDLRALGAEVFVCDARSPSHVPGWPDRVIVHPRIGTALVEFKHGTSPRPVQRMMLDRLRRKGACVVVIDLRTISTAEGVLEEIEKQLFSKESP